jgi:hypothetical protein
LEIVSVVHLERSNYEVPLQILWEQSREKRSAGRPVASVPKPEADGVILLEEPDVLLRMKKDVEESAHSDSAEGSATESRSPKVARTFRQRPIWQVSLPFSKSLMKRTPVPLAKAKSGCLSFS